MNKEKENGGTGDGSTHLLADEEGPERPSNSGDAEGDPTEKLVAQDGKLTLTTDASEVKFISADSQNGDAKIDIEKVMVAFGGMGKEELMKFANDPFWIRMRWTLFALFWLLWVGMLLGAVAIIVFAPKCAAPAPLKWWEETALYEVKFSSPKNGENQDGIGDLEGLRSKLDYIADLGVKGVIISSIFQTSNDSDPLEGVTDFKSVSSLFGTIDDVKNLTAAMESKGLHLILDFIPNYTSNKHPWFIRSVNKEIPFKDYYIWAQPNNWRSVYGESAWTMNPNRSEYYLHQFRSDQPDLNFRNPHVIEEFKGIFKFWTDLGVSGFQLSRVEFLLEDKDRTPAVIGSNIGTGLGDYDFFNHRFTANLPEVLDVLKTMREAILNFTDGEGVLAVTSNVTKYGPLGDRTALTPGGMNGSVDIIRNVGLFSSLKPDFTADDLNNTIHKWMADVPNDTRIFWELGSNVRSRADSRLSPLECGLNAVLMLLPGTPIIHYGDELQENDAGIFGHEVNDSSLIENLETKNAETEKSASSVSELYKELVKLRTSPSVMHGLFESTVFNDTVFAYTRLKSGSPGYLIAFNPSDTHVSADFTNLKHMADEKLTTVAHSSNFEPDSKYRPAALPVPPKSVIVLSFVPKLD